MEKQQYYSINPIMEKCPDAKYYMGFGERSNGKTYAVTDLALKRYFEEGTQLALVRRYAQDFKEGYAKRMLQDLVVNEVAGNKVAKYSKNEWNDIYYYNGAWYFQKVDENGNVEKKNPKPFAYRFAISDVERSKSTSYPEVRTIFFDEFLTRELYLPDEFIKFMNLISTIVRDRDNIQIFMMGNTVNKYNCPYFNEMGITHAKTMKKGTIDIYTFGDSGLKVAVEFTDNPNKKKKSDVYFAFKNNPRLAMITSGSWEIDLYPHLPMDYEREDIIYQFFIDFDGEMLHGKVIYKDEHVFAFLHRKTSVLKALPEEVIYSDKIHIEENYSPNFLKPRNKMEQKILKLYVENRFYYQDNMVGDMVDNFVNWCKTQK